MATADYLKYWKNGGLWDLWIHDAPTVADFVKQHSLRPIKHEEVLARKSVHDTATAATAGVIPRIGYAGGMKAPHLHYEGEIYSLTRAQWRAFAENTLETLRERLAEVKSVGFDQLMELSDAVNSVT